MANHTLFSDVDQTGALLGVTLVGATPENGKKLLFTLAFVLFVLLLGLIVRAFAGWLMRGRSNVRLEFWIQQGVRLAVTLFLIVGVLSIWFEDPTQLATAAGLVIAGLSFALQQVITSIAGYLVILSGKTFKVGDRIVVGGVRGEVIAIDFIKTTLMEIGQPSTYADAASVSWVRSRQYTGRIVFVSNARIFVDPVYNYTHDFPYIWEEISIPIAFAADHNRTEQILLEAARHHTVRVSELGEDARQEMERRYFVTLGDLEPKVYFRLTNDWLELTVRFIAADRGVRDLKDAMSRDILRALADAGIEIASASFAIVGLPPIKLQRKSD